MAQASNFKFPTPGGLATCPFVCASKSTPIQVGTATTWAFDSTCTNNFQEIAVDTSAFAIKTNGTLWAWGANGNGQLGDGTVNNASSPVQVIGAATPWKSVSTNHYCGVLAIKTDGTLWGWGVNTCGGLGNGTTTTRSSPAQVVGAATTWKQVSTGVIGTNPNAIAIKTDGTLWTWGGAQGVGVLGAGLAAQAVSSPIQTIAGGTTWLQAQSVGNAQMAIKTDGTLWTWGCNVCGILGDGTTINKCSPVQVVGAATTWKQLINGQNGTSCSSGGIKTDGTLWMWGVNVCGVLGDVTTINKSSPVQVVGAATTWKQVSFLGQCSTIATKIDGTLWIWGNACIGIGCPCVVSSPIQIAYPTSKCWCQVVGGGAAGVASWEWLAVNCDGTLWATGPSSILGNSIVSDYCDSTNPFYPASDFSDVFVCADCFSTGGLWVWGPGSNLISNANTSSPVQTLGWGTNWKQLSSPSHGTGTGVAAVKSDGTLWLWGTNDLGQMGNGTTITTCSPVQTIAQGTNWLQASWGANRGANAAIKQDGTLWLWGGNLCGQLGNASTLCVCSPVQTIATGTNWKQVSTGQTHSAAIKQDGTLWTWGGGLVTDLGNGTSGAVSSPVQTISAATTWSSVAVGLNITAAIKTDGSLWVWGCGNSALGNGLAPTTACSPIQTIATGTNWKQVSADQKTGQNIAAVKTDGTLWIWGCNSSGELGDGTTISRSSPVQTIAGGNNWKCVITTFQSTVAMKTDGSMWTWGCNSCGQLMTGNTTNYSSPVQTLKSMPWLQIDHVGGITANTW